MTNEESIAKGIDPDASDDDYGSGDSDFDEVNDEKEFNDIKDKLKKMNNGQMDDADFEDEDDEDDEDYEVEGDDMGLYDSNLDETDELLHLKETVDAIHSSN